MKKLGKKLSYLTKVVLVIGLLISNLSSLSIVFAYESDDLLKIDLNDDKLNITYSGDLDEENVELKIYENYKYLDNTFYYVDDNAISEGRIGKESTVNILSIDEFLTDGYEIDTILKDIIFDGFYEVVVQLLDESDQILSAATYSSEVKHSSGLTIKLYDEFDNEIELQNGVYSVSKDNSKVKVVAKLLSGGLLPSDIYHKENLNTSEEFNALELLDDLFSKEFDYSGYLYGEYNQPLVLELYKEVNDSDELELVEISSSFNILYGDKNENDLVLNGVLSDLELDNRYQFYDEKLYVLLSDEANTIFDLYDVLEKTFGGNGIVSYTISNNMYEDILSSYDSEVYEGTVEEYLKSIIVDNNVSIKLFNTGLTLNYDVVVVGDINGDNVIDAQDLSELINQFVNSEDSNKYNDLNRDEEFSVLDIMYLDQIIKNGSYDFILEELDAMVGGSLVLNADDIVSGDEFTVSYVVSVSQYEVSGISGLLEYDKEKLELISITSPLEWNGSYKDGKFLYLGNDSLLADKVLNEDDEEDIVAHDYVVLDVTFRAISAGNTEISLVDYEFINQDTYLLVETDIKRLTVVINASDDNSLSSLIVAGNEIELEEDVLDYEITVSNDVVVADVEALVSNVCANIVSIVTPEELIEGKNVITITIESESGNIKVYTVVVNREIAPEEESTTQINYTTTNNTDNKVDNDKKDDLVITTPADDEDDDAFEEEENNLSRIIIIILILLVIAGLIYLIFKDEDDDETKKVNKELNKLKKEKVELSTENEVKKTTSKSKTKGTSSRTTTNKNKKSSNKKTER